MSLTLILPDLTGTAAQPLVKAVCDAYAKRKLAVRISRNNDNTEPFREAAIKAVVHSASHDSHSVQEPLAGEFFLLDRQPLEEGRMAWLTAEISLHATSSRWAQVSTEDAKHLICHVLSDARRRATFDAVLQSGMFEGVTVLRGYDVEGLRVFLPPVAKPSATGLHFLHFMLTKHPEILGMEIPGDRGPVLAAIAERQVEGKPVLWCLSLQAVQFKDLRADDSRIWQGVRVEFGTMVPAPEAREQVRQWLVDNSPTYGYRLRLRPTRYRHAEQRDIDLLLERQMQIEDQLALLQTLLPPRPLLYRFTQEQLPLLAQALRSYAVKDLVEDRISYACQSNSPSDGGPEPQVWHFLLIDAQLAHRTEPFIPDWEPLAAKSQVAFWLDPFWSHYHPTSRGNVLLFVPQGEALFPTPYSWGAAEMDVYLRNDVLGRLFHGSGPVQKIPPRPLYVFDRSRRDADTIEIAVLDQDKFEPVQQKLGWINSNLFLLDDYEDLAKMIREFANEEVTRRRHRELADRCDEAREQFHKAAQTVARDFINNTKDLTTSLETALGHLHEHTTTTVAQLTVLQADLERLIAMQKAEAALETEARGAANESEAARRDAIATVATTEKQAKATLDDLAQRRASMKAKVEDAIRAQRQAIEQLRRTLQSHWF